MPKNRIDVERSTIPADVSRAGGQLQTRTIGPTATQPSAATRADAATEGQPASLSASHAEPPTSHAPSQASRESSALSSVPESPHRNHPTRNAIEEEKASGALRFLVYTLTADINVEE
ncbi:hypothetical protein FKP32DRAFT_1677484 [Trametes sanguinea]|nr:hypothetical protein FKP32DRAFT_1677484 [Trametes sanguinea]